MAAVELAEPSPGGLLTPNQPMMYACRASASTQLPSSHAHRPGSAWLPGQPDAQQGHVRQPRRLSGCASTSPSANTPPSGASSSLSLATCSILTTPGYWLTFQLFAQSPPFSHLLAVYNNYDFSGPLDVVARYSEVAKRGAQVRRTDYRRRPPAGSGRRSTAYSYPEQRLDNDLCQAVVAGTPSTCAARPQGPQMASSVHIGSPACEAEQVMTNIETVRGGRTSVEHVVELHRVPD